MLDIRACAGAAYMPLALKVGADLAKHKAPVRQKLQRRKVFTWNRRTVGDSTGQRLAPLCHYQPTWHEGKGTNLAAVALG